MKIDYDDISDVAYINLNEENHEIDFTYACDPTQVKTQIHLDFDKNSVLRGIEILGASKHLPKELLK